MIQIPPQIQTNQSKNTLQYYMQAVNLAQIPLFQFSDTIAEKYSVFRRPVTASYDVHIWHDTKMMKTLILLTNPSTPLPD